MHSEGKGRGGGADGGSEKGSVDVGLGAARGPVSGEATEAKDAANGEAAQAQGPPPAPVPSGDSAHRRAPSRRQMLEFTVTVPFQSCLEADLERRTLLPVVQRIGGEVRKEITVNGSDMTVRLTADDSCLLQIAIAIMVSLLYLLVRAMQHSWACVLKNL